MASKTPVQKDYKYLLNKRESHDLEPRARLVPFMGWIMGLATALAVIAVSTHATSGPDQQTAPELGEQAAPQAQSAQPLNVAMDNSAQASQPSASLSSEPEPIAESTAIAQSDPWREVRIRNGDNLAIIFKKQGIAPQVLHSIMQAGVLADELKNIKPGQLLRFKLLEEALQEFHYVMGATRKLIVTRDTDGYQIEEIVREYEKRSQIAQGVIDSSLFLSAQEAGLSDNVTMDLAHIFGWDIDFALDIRQGDRFTLVYEELFLDGEKVRDGNILAAEFHNDGKIHRAFRYTDPNGKTSYYSPDGKNMRKTFLRTPVDFSRISSYFGRRKHPVLNRIRAHNGVDYAAPRGTPIKSTGNGKIIFRGRKGGYGRTVVIQHGSGYRTLYAHMNSFNRKQRRGSMVKQGEVIGFVGSSGLATGPHLHYEFLVNGVHRNPLRVKLPDAKPLPADYFPDFQSKTLGMMALLDIVTNSTIAMNQQ